MQEDEERRGRQEGGSTISTERGDEQRTSTRAVAGYRMSESASFYRVEHLLPVVEKKCSLPPFRAESVGRNPQRSPFPFVSQLTPTSGGTTDSLIDACGTLEGGLELLSNHGA